MKYLVLVLMFISGSCQERPEIRSIEVFTIFPFSTSPRPLVAGDVIRYSDEPDFKSRVINLRDSISIISRLVDRMQPDSLCKVIDARGVLILKYNNNHADTLSGNYSCLI